MGYGNDDGANAAAAAATTTASAPPLKDTSNRRSSKKLAKETETAALMNSLIITKQHNSGPEETSTLGGFSANQDDIMDADGVTEGKSIDTSAFDYANVAGATTAVVGGIIYPDDKRSATADANNTSGLFSDSDIPGDDNQFVIYAPG